MKIRPLPLFALLFACTFLLGAAPPKRLRFDSTTCLLLQGSVVNASEDRTTACIVELLKSGGDADTITLKNGRETFRFTLQRNTYYAIRITKKGYLPKLISINTEMRQSSEIIHKFSFRTNLIPETEKHRLNSDALDFPVAIVFYDGEYDDFHYNEEYSSSIRRELYNRGPAAGQLSGNP